MTPGILLWGPQTSGLSFSTLPWSPWSQASNQPLGALTTGARPGAAAPLVGSRAPVLAAAPGCHCPPATSSSLLPSEEVTNLLLQLRANAVLGQHQTRRAVGVIFYHVQQGLQWGRIWKRVNAVNAPQAPSCHSPWYVHRTYVEANLNLWSIPQSEDFSPGADWLVRPVPSKSRTLRCGWRPQLQPASLPRGRLGRQHTHTHL